MQLQSLYLEKATTNAILMGYGGDMRLGGGEGARGKIDHVQSI